MPHLIKMSKLALEELSCQGKVGRQGRRCYCYQATKMPSAERGYYPTNRNNTFKGTLCLWGQVVLCADVRQIRRLLQTRRKVVFPN